MGCSCALNGVTASFALPVTISDQGINLAVRQTMKRDRCLHQTFVGHSVNPANSRAKGNGGQNLVVPTAGP